MRTFLQLVCAAALICSARSAPAAIIFDNGPPNPFPPGFVAAFSDFDRPFEAADDFVLPGRNFFAVTDAHWWGIYVFDDSPPAQDDFTLRIFTDESGSPAAIPAIDLHLGAVSRTDTGIDVEGFDLYEFDAVFAPINLPSAVTLWLSIVNNTQADTNDDWAWSVSAPTGNTHGRVDSTDPSWDNFQFELAFQLTDDARAVPEPSLRSPSGSSASPPPFATLAAVPSSTLLGGHWNYHAEAQRR